MLASLVTALVLSSQQSDVIPIDCAQAVTTVQFTRCADLSRRREDSRMARYLSSASQRAHELDETDPDGHRSAWLKASQSAWKAYAEIACAGVFDQWSRGTVRTVMASGCWQDLIRERTHRIWADNLTFVDSTPPLLPEPVGPADATEPLTVD